MLSAASRGNCVNHIWTRVKKDKQVIIALIPHWAGKSSSQPVLGAKQGNIFILHIMYIYICINNN